MLLTCRIYLNHDSDCDRSACQFLVIFREGYRFNLLFNIGGGLENVMLGWLGSRVVSVLDSGAVGPVLGKLFTPIVPLFTKKPN